MNSKLCSIIIPVYNDWAYLRQLLKKLITLSANHSAAIAELFEIIVVNDGSVSDQTDSLPQSPMVKCFSKPNGGVSSARNFGLVQADADFVMFLDCDDDVPDNLFEILLRDLHGASLDVIQYSYGRSDGNHQHDKVYQVKPGEGSTLFANLLLKKNSFHICSFLFNRDFLLSNAIRFDQSIGLSEDVLFVFESLARAGNAIARQDVIYYYNARPDSVIASFKGAREAEHLSAFKKIQTISHKLLGEQQQRNANFFLKTCIANLYLRSTKLAMQKDSGEYDLLLEKLRAFYQQIGRSSHPFTVKSLFIIVLELMINSRAYYQISRKINRGYYG